MTLERHHGEVFERLRVVARGRGLGFEPAREDVALGRNSNVMRRRS